MHATRPHEGVEGANAFLDKAPSIRIIVVSWCGNDLARKTSRHKCCGIDERRLVAIVEMCRAAKAAAGRAIILGPGTAGSLVLPPPWDAATDSCMATLREPGIYHFDVNQMWARTVKLPHDTYLAWIAWV